MTDIFTDPPAEYRSVPFWSWNCRVTRQLIDGDLDAFVRMGFGGVCIHPRAGLDVEYLGDEYMELVKYAIAGCQKRGLGCWLYDDERFPSGTAGGIVTREGRHRGKYLLMSEKPREGELLAAYLLEFEDDRLAAFARLRSQQEIDAAKGKREKRRRLRYAYLTEFPPEPRFNGSAYIDATDSGAVERFIEVTHERYLEKLGGELSGVRAFFTDEPRTEPPLPPELRMTDPLTHGDFAVPYTPAFEERFWEKYGAHPLDGLPAVIWDHDDPGAGELRRRWRDAMCDCFAQNYMDALGIWCREHGLWFTGHILGEDSLSSQTSTVGEAMRCYRGMDMPGLDVLCDDENYLAALQCVSVAEAMGKAGVMSELYGATDWDCPFLTYKLQGDWQAALGVTHRVPHLAHMSLEGEAKRDWPASISVQEPWWERYRLIEDHFARLSTALRRGRRITRVAVISPLEAVWRLPLCGFSQRAAQMSRDFDALIRKLLTSLIDVRIISESMLESREMTLKGFEAVIVPEPGALRPSTSGALAKFEGQILLSGEFCKLEEFRDVCVECRTPDVKPELLYQLREDGERRWLFVCHTKNNSHDEAENNDIKVRGEYSVRVWDTATGKVREATSSVRGGWTHIRWRAYRDESGLFELRVPRREHFTLDAAVETRLTEPNALILDTAQYALDGEEPSEAMEILRLDNALRDRLGLEPRRENMLQPWATAAGESRELTLIYEFTSDIAFDSLTLALERPEEQEVTLNGRKAQPADGYFVDRSFKLMRLSDIRPGKNRLVVRRKFNARTNLEAMYLLGDFRVRDGALAAPAPVKLGDLTSQGLPHYTGNTVYSFGFETGSSGTAYLRAPEFAAPLIEASVDGGRAVSVLTTRPVPLGELEAGRHTLELTVYSGRYNLLGALHNRDAGRRWHGPDSWRPQGEDWTPELVTKPSGLLKPIEITIEI